MAGKRWIYVGLLALLAPLACRGLPRSGETTHLALVVPKGYWGFFIVPYSKETADRGFREIRVPKNGMCSAIPHGAFTLSPAKYEDGSLVPNFLPLFETGRMGPPDDEVALDWLQETHPKYPDAQLWFLGSHDQLQAAWNKMEIGLKKVSSGSPK